MLERSLFLVSTMYFQLMTKEAAHQMKKSKNKNAGFSSGSCFFRIGKNIMQIVAPIKLLIVEKGMMFG